MKTEELFSLCMVIAIVSFLGFVVENLWLAVTKGFMDNRNMCFPFLLGYGLAMLVIYALFGTPSALSFLGKKLHIKSVLARKLIYFLFVMLCICVGEILLGKLVEKVCHFYWWDYSKLPLHITRYTTLPTSAGFSLMVLAFMEHCFMPLIKYFLRWDYELLCATAVLLMTIMMADFIYSGYLMYKNKKITRRWMIDTTKTKGYRLLHS